MAQQTRVQSRANEALKDLFRQQQGGVSFADAPAPIGREGALVDIDWGLSYAILSNAQNWKNYAALQKMLKDVLKMIKDTNRLLTAELERIKARKLTVDGELVVSLERVRSLVKLDRPYQRGMLLLDGVESLRRHCDELKTQGYDEAEIIKIIKGVFAKMDEVRREASTSRTLGLAKELHLLMEIKQLEYSNPPWLATLVTTNPKVLREMIDEKMKLMLDANTAAEKRREQLAKEQMQLLRDARTKQPPPVKPPGAPGGPQPKSDDARPPVPVVGKWSKCSICGARHKGGALTCPERDTSLADAAAAAAQAADAGEQE